MANVFQNESTSVKLNFKSFIFGIFEAQAKYSISSKINPIQHAKYSVQAK